MKTRFYIICSIFLLGISSISAQGTLNSYKYIIVPNQFEFQKSEDQYQINSLTSFLFNKNGFTIIDGDQQYPEDLVNNPCLALKVNIRDTSGMLTIKVEIDLVDCRNTVIFTTIEGKSRIKDYTKGYNDAIRNAFVSIESLNYKYEESEISASDVVVPAAVTKAATNVKPSDQSQSITKPAVQKASEVSTVVAPVTVAATNEASTETGAKEKYTIEGTYIIDIWGTCNIKQKGNVYEVIGGDEDYVFATISKTSKPNIFMVKKTGFSSSQLLELNSNGNIQIDTENGFKEFKRIN